MRITVDVPDKIVKNVDQKARANFRSRKQQIESDLIFLYSDKVGQVVSDIQNKIGIKEHSVASAMEKLGVSNK